ncbi:transglutaminase domain-containing protein [Gelidibacter sp.]|uniref:transglutaminase domain-containing protein n=1 Tax=Gelidibacter sp. TaxID=2018083 RepID=UPI002BEE5B24|nr:transglutaminase domain-containing protein [Gelidibacter sp.]HUH29644.1 transglutaminase domain-containing protein [Gelidibacter sp.]
MKKIAYLLIFIAFNWTNAQDYRFGKVSKEELQETAYPMDSEANAAILYLNQKTYYNYVQSEGFVQITEVYKRIKIYNKDGYDWATGEIELRDDGSKRESVVSLKTVTYTQENGKIEVTKLKKDGMFDEKNNKYWKTSKFTMPNIKDGCVIELEYKITSPYISIRDINLQYGIPIKELDMYVRIPEYFNFNKYVNPRATYIPKIINSEVMRSEVLHLKNTGIGANGFVKSNHSSEKWEFKENKTEIKLKNVPALKKESYVSELSTYKTKLIWEYAYSRDLKGVVKNFATSWDEVTKTIYDDTGFGAELKQTKYFEDEVSALIKGVTDKTEKMNLIFNFVKSKVKWNDYYGFITDNGVKKAYKEGVGNVADINLMLTAMLRYAKINANPMLVSTRSNDIPVFPATGGFNYVVAAVEVLNDVVILDATDKFSTANVLPVRAINWQGRIIREAGTSAWFDLSPKETVKENTSLNAKINDDLSIDGKVRGQMTSFAAKNFRSKYENFNTEEKLMALEKDKGEIEVSNYEVTDMDVIDKPIMYVYDYNLKNGLEQIGDKVFLTPMLFFAPKENPFKDDKREYPIDFVYAMNDRYTINVIIPDGYVVESMPENSVVQFQGSAGEFKYIAIANGKMLQFLISLDLNQSLILPDEYSDFKQFYQLMTEKQTEKVVLKKI